jgi:aspartate ammonia-lyase
MSHRTESDLLGPIAVPAGALWGGQTQRGIQNFPLDGQRTIGSYPTMIAALLLIKKAAALTNRDLGLLSAEQAEAIATTVNQLLQQPQPDLFPVHALHGGGGTSANMNVNEVLANIAEERLGGRRGEYRLVHPNDHLNLNQSTNDVYPTACHMAIILQWPSLRRGLDRLIAALDAKSREFQDHRHLARTCFQDAVDIALSDFFSGYAGFLRRKLDRIGQAVGRLYAVNLGGSIIGRAEDVPPAYLEAIVPNLRLVTRDPNYHQAANLFDAAQNPDDLAVVSAHLDVLARGLIKIANDFRVLGSGPEAGLGELLLPAVQPGSSAMPGKVNPVIPEFLIQLCFRVIGNHAMCTAGIDHGELDLNVWESSMVFAVLEAMELIETGATVFAERCVRGLKANAEINEWHSRTLIPMLATLARQYGYSAVTHAYKEADGDGERMKVLLAEWSERS